VRKAEIWGGKGCVMKSFGKNVIKIIGIVWALFFVIGVVVMAIDDQTIGVIAFALLAAVGLLPFLFFRKKPKQAMENTQEALQDVQYEMPPTETVPHADLDVTDLVSLESPDTTPSEWSISISFGKSSSSNFSKALYLAKETSRKYIHVDTDGEGLHQAYFSADMDSYLSFIQLYELVSGWKSSFAMINGKLADRKIVQGLNYCYGDKCRSGRSDFCFGASQFTENPFGCHRLQISKYNNPWWMFSHQKGNKVLIDKTALRARINDYCSAYIDCPSFDYDAVLARLNALPDSLTQQQFDSLRGSGGYMVKIGVDINKPR